MNAEMKTPPGSRLPDGANSITNTTGVTPTQERNRCNGMYRKSKS